MLHGRETKKSAKPAKRTQSSETSVDSDAMDSVVSDLEFSRVLDADEITESRPESNSTPRKSVASDAEHLSLLRESAHTQMTQPVNVLTESQLKTVMGEDDEEEEVEVEEAAGDGRETLVKENAVTTSFPTDGNSEHILSTSEGEYDERHKWSQNKHASSRQASTMPASVALSLIENVASRANSRTSQQVSAGTDQLHDVKVIDETPIKLLSMQPQDRPSFVYLLVKWAGNPNWWPARCSWEDYNARSANARVLFRKNEFGDTNLHHHEPVLFVLKPEDVVHVVGRSGKSRFRVVVIGINTLPESTLWTNDGYNVLRVRNINSDDKEFTINAEDVYLTKSDMQLYLSRRKKQGATDHAVSKEHWADVTPFQHPVGNETDRNLDPVHTPFSASLAEHTTRSNISANVTAPSVGSKPPGVVQPLRSFMPTTERDPLDTPTNTGSKRRTANRDTNQTTVNTTPRKRRPKSAPLPESKISPASSPPHSDSEDNARKGMEEEENYILKSSPVVSPTRRPRSRATARHYLSSLDDVNVLTLNTTEAPKNTNLFKNCIFSISTHDTQSAKNRARNLLVMHGAKVLEEGLKELVSLTDIADDESGSFPDHDFDFGDATFAAVLADEPRRTMKYLEMVALGWPCLSITYMHDCISQNKMLDWRSYLLPAGDCNLVGKKMTVSQDVSAFYRRWISGFTLDQQFNNRKITFRCCAPLCIETNRQTLKSNLVLLASFCAPRFRLWFYSSKRNIPQGSILLDLKPTTNISKEIKRTDPLLLEQLQNYAAAEFTVVKNTEWMIQCIINGDLV